MSNKQHVQIPDPSRCNDLKPTDRLVYANIRRFMNKDTMECHPSIATIAKCSGIGEKTVKRSIERLIKWGYITKKTGSKGIANTYKFQKLDDNFEMFTPEFLDHPDTTPNEKAYLIGLQSQCFKNDHYAMTTYSNKEIADNLNMSEPSVIKYNNSLKSKDIMLELQTYKHDSEGFNKVVKAIDMARIGQQVLFEIAVNHEDRIQQLEKTIELLINENKELKKQLHPQIQREFEM